MKVCVDRGKCSGLGICESIVPEIFEVNDNGDLVVLRDGISDAEAAMVEQAIRSCPTEALSLES